jgi:hypothetical protein
MKAHATNLPAIVLLSAALPAFGIVIPSSTTGVIPGAIYDPSHYLAPYNTVFNGVNLNGVVYLIMGNTLCSGALISLTQVITAAHCMNGNTPQVNFIDSTNNPMPILASSYVVDPGYGGDFTKGADLAIVNLPGPAPSFATPYQLYTGVYTYGSTITLTGFGYTGTGDTGETSLDVQRRVGENSYDTNGTISGVSSTILEGDFDNGQAANNGITGSSLGLPDEVDIGHGDSGGPSFYNGQLIGIHDFIDCNASKSVGACPPPNSYYGELFGDTSVEANAAWIASVMTPEPATWIFCLSAAALLAILRARRGRQMQPKACPVRVRSNRSR